MQSLLFQKMSQMGLQLGTESVGAYEATSSRAGWLPASVGHLDQSVKCAGGWGAGSKHQRIKLALVGAERDLGFQILHPLNYIHRPF